MKTYLCGVSGDDPGDDWYFRCMADDRAHAVEQALSEETITQVWAVYVEVSE